MPSQALEVVLAHQPTREQNLIDLFRVQSMATTHPLTPANGVILQLVVATVDSWQSNITRRTSLAIGPSPSNFSVARVLASNHATLRKDDLVMSTAPNIRWQMVQPHDGEGLRRIPTESKVPLTAIPRGVGHARKDGMVWFARPGRWTNAAGQGSCCVGCCRCSR